MNPVAHQDQPATTPAHDADAANIWRYGRRYVRKVDSNGVESIEEIPLVLEDLLHPQEGDEHVTTFGHDKDCNYLSSGLDHYRPRDNVVVAHDVNVEFDVPGLGPLRPDVAAYELAEVPDVLDAVATVRLDRRRDVTLLTIEVTSPDTRPNDLGIKLDYYFRAEVQQYVIVDRARYPNRPIELLGYVRGKRGFRKQKPDSKGRIQLLAFDLWLGVEDGRAVLYDGDEEVPVYSEWAERAEKEQQRAEAERQRADDAEAVNRALQAELARLRKSQS